VVEQLKTLPSELQWRVLEFTRTLSLSAPRGASGKQLLRFAGAVHLSDVKLMHEAIEKGCEQVDIYEFCIQKNSGVYLNKRDCR
jgi:hypothetical protein